MTNPWEQTGGPYLQQGDWLLGCPVPIFSITQGSAETGDIGNVDVARVDVLVVTQSCDLAVRGGKPPKARVVAVCPIYPLAHWTESNQNFKAVRLREQARRGEVAGVHLIASPEAPGDNQRALLASFSEIYSLPYPLISAHAAGVGDRWRLRSPYLEHFSQAFARFFMRVGLPSDIPPYEEAKAPRT